MNLFKSILGLNFRRKAAFLLVVYFFFAAFMPFSHAHAIEESHHGNQHVSIDRNRNPGHQEHGHHHHDHRHDHDGHGISEHRHPHQDGFTGQCCRPAPVDSDHHHFISEFFHYSSERRKLLNYDASPLVRSVSFSSGVLSAPPDARVELFHLPDIPVWPRSHFFRRVSGNSPPSTFAALSE